MAQPDNPFASGESSSESALEQEALIAETARYLRQTQPWVMFLALLGALGSLLIVGMGLFSVIASSQQSGEYAGLGAMFGIFYLILGLVYVIPTALMGRYGMAISGAGLGDMAGIARAVRAQRDLWMFIGGMTLLMMILYCGGLGLMAVGLSAAL